MKATISPSLFIKGCQCIFSKNGVFNVKIKKMWLNCIETILNKRTNGE